MCVQQISLGNFSLPIPVFGAYFAIIGYFILLLFNIKIKIFSHFVRSTVKWWWINIAKSQTAICLAAYTIHHLMQWPEWLGSSFMLILGSHYSQGNFEFKRFGSYQLPSSVNGECEFSDEGSWKLLKLLNSKFPWLVQTKNAHDAPSYTQSHTLCMYKIQCAYHHTQLCMKSIAQHYKLIYTGRLCSMAIFALWVNWASQYSHTVSRSNKTPLLIQRFFKSFQHSHCHKRTVQ